MTGGAGRGRTTLTTARLDGANTATAATSTNANAMYRRTSTSTPQHVQNEVRCDDYRDVDLRQRVATQPVHDAFPFFFSSARATAGSPIIAAKRSSSVGRSALATSVS